MILEVFVMSEVVHEQAPATSPSVTFLCTAYRTEDTIEATIDSVVAQTRADWQLVVVDNGMSDTIAALVEPYTTDSRITLVRQENQFAWGGVNAAARNAEGRYLAVLHTDDLVLPTFVERLVPLLDADDGTAALAPDAHYLTGTGVRRETFREAVPQRYCVGAPVGYRELIEGWVPYYTALIRRELWDELGGFRSDARNVEDLGLWLDLMTHGYVVRCIEEPLAAYREDEDSDSHSAQGVEVMEESWSRVMTEAISEHGSDEDRAALKVALVRSRHRRATVRARRMLLEGDYSGARDAAQEARREKGDPRTRATLWALTAAPGLLHAGYRSKKAAERRLRRLAPRTPVGEVRGQADQAVS